MGWDLILEYIIGTASNANALSQYIDILTGKRISGYFSSLAPIHILGFGHYFDILAFVITLVVICFMIIGVEESALMNKLFTVLNIIILMFIIASGSTKANTNNWFLETKVTDAIYFILT